MMNCDDRQLSEILPIHFSTKIKLSIVQHENEKQRTGSRNLIFAFGVKTCVNDVRAAASFLAEVLAVARDDSLAGGE